MATNAGLLGSASLNDLGDYEIPYKPAAGLKASVTLTICNTASSALKVRAGYVTGAQTSPAAGRWLLGGAAGRSIPPGETIQVTTTLGPLQGIAVAFVQPGTGANLPSGLHASINGLEEALA